MDFQVALHSRKLEPQKEAPSPTSPTYFKIEDKEVIQYSPTLPPIVQGFIQNTQLEESVVVPPSKFDNNKELILGFIAISLLIFFMFMFWFSMYVGTKQYKKYLKDKLTPKWEDLETGLNPMTGFNTCKEEKSLISPSRLIPIEENDDLIIETPLAVEEINSCQDFETATPISSTDNDRECTEGEYEKVEEEFYEDLEAEREVTKSISDINEFANLTDTRRLRINSPERRHRNNLDYQIGKNLSMEKALSALINYSEIDTIDIINESHGSYGLKCETEGPEKKEEQLNNSKLSRITYRKSEIVQYEPIQLYNMIKYSDDGDLLVTDLVFSETVIMKSYNLIELEKEYNKIRFCLGNNQRDDVTKKIELIRFANSSLGMKKINNPRIFLFSYELLIDKILDEDCLNIISELSKFTQMAIIEVIIKYCLDCWKYESSNHSEIDSLFKLNNISPHVPTKSKIFKLVTSMLVTGYRMNLLEQVLIFFTAPSTPCGTVHILDEILINSTLQSRSKDLLEFLKRQVEDEHTRCCSSKAEYDHWKYTSAQMSPIKETPNSNKESAGKFIKAIDSGKSLEPIHANDDKLPGSLSSSPNLKNHSLFF